MMEDTLKVIPKGGHDWNKVIDPGILKRLLLRAGFSEIEFKGFEVKGNNEKTGELEVEINKKSFRCLYREGNGLKKQQSE